MKDHPTMYINHRISNLSDLMKTSNTEKFKSGSKLAFWFSYPRIGRLKSDFSLKHFSKIKIHSSETGKY